MGAHLFCATWKGPSPTLNTRFVVCKGDLLYLSFYSSSEFLRPAMLMDN